MPETLRVYTWSLDLGDDLSPVAVTPQVKALLDGWAAGNKWLTGWIMDPSGDSLKIHTMVRSRDRWMVNRRQWRIAAAMAASLRLKRAAFGDPVPWPLPPAPRGARREGCQNCGGDLVCCGEEQQQV